MYKGEAPEAPKLAPFLTSSSDPLLVIREWMQVVIAGCVLAGDNSWGQQKWTATVLSPLWKAANWDPPQGVDHAVRLAQNRLIYGIHRYRDASRTDEVALQQLDDPETLIMLATLLAPGHTPSGAAFIASETYAALLSGARQNEPGDVPGLLLPTKAQAAWMDQQLGAVWPEIDTVGYDPDAMLPVNADTLVEMVRDRLPGSGDVDRQVAAILVDSYQGYATWVGYPDDLCPRIVAALQGSRHNPRPKEASPKVVKELRREVRNGPPSSRHLGRDQAYRNKEVAKLFAEALMIAEAPSSRPKDGERNRLLKMLETANHGFFTVPKEHAPASVPEIWARIREAIPLQS